MQLIEADERGIAIGFEKMQAMLERLPEVSSYEELVARTPGLIADAVDRIQEAAAPFDAFDVIESLKMRELPMGLLGFSEREHDGMPAAIEIAAIVLLARGSRGAVATPGDNPGEAVESIGEAARELLLLGHLATFDLPTGSTPEVTAKAEIAHVLKNHELSVRNRQYESIRDLHDPKLFGDQYVSRDMRAALGFDYSDYHAVRRAIRDVGAERLSSAAAEFYGAFEDATAAANWQVEALAENVRDRAMAGLAGLFLRPGDRASFTAGDLAGRTGLDELVVRAVLAPFAQAFAPGDATEAVSAFLGGDNPLSSRSLLVDSSDNFLSTGAQLGDDALRAAVEKALSGKAKDRYIRVRTRASEELASSYFRALISPDQMHGNLKYWSPAPGQGPDVVGKGASGVRTTARLTEMDALFVVEDVAICVEVKGASLRHESRGGHAVKLADDLSKTVGEAADQAERARTLIEVNHGLQTEGGWLDLDEVREVHSVVVTLEDLGPAGIALDSMVRAGVVKTRRVPWIVSLHDLAIITRVVEQPAELLLYLRRRTAPAFARVFHAVDELDLFMMFLGSGLFLEPDPDHIAAANAAAPPVTSAQRRRYQRSLVPKTVGTHTDPLDHWVYASESSEELDTHKYPKPRFRSEPRISAIVADIARERKPGWLRAGADLLAFSGDTQTQISSIIARTAAGTRSDGKWHSAFMSQMSDHGHFGLFLGSVPTGQSVAQASARLEQYARAKAYQMHADRSLRLVVATSGEIAAIDHGRHDWQEDPELDELVVSMGLVPASRVPRSMPPPSSRRSTLRLRGTRKGKKRRR